MPFYFSLYKVDRNSTHTNNYSVMEEEEGREDSLKFKIHSKFAYRQIWTSFIANLLQVMQGSVLALSSIILPQVINNKDSSDISFTDEEGSWFASIYCIGYVYGSLLGGLQSDFFGRKISLLIDCLVATTGIFLIAFSQDFYLLIIGRLLCGQASGSGTVSISIYICEISHPNVRSITGTFLANFYLSGYSLTTILGSFIHWRIVAGIIATCPILGSLLLLTCYESPIWLLRNGKDEAAMESLVYFHGVLHAEGERVSIVSKLNKLKHREDDDLSVMKKLGNKITRLRDSSFWKPFSILFMIVPVFCQWNGVSIIAFYLVLFAEKIQVAVNPYYAASIITIIRAIFGNLSMLFIRKQPIRKIYIISVIFIGLGTSIISVYHYLLNNHFFESLDANEMNVLQWTPAIGLLIYSIAACSGYFQVTYMIQGEIFPHEVRSFGCGLLGFIDGISSFLAAKVAPSMLHDYGTSIYFAYATIMCVIMCIFAYFFLPETHGKRLDEIEDNFLKSDVLNSQEINVEEEEILKLRWTVPEI
uniref:Major facilitator superfamily (MFS) profile domain-containing protein n=2 Tax=Lepeophtheirus salmonis TaxID=72036 RepID=A0A0K2VGQ4_LEPSM